MWADCTTADKARDKDGYVRCFYKGRNDVMHRAVWDLANGPIPEGMVVRHKCDNPACFNLSHLELGTVGDNNQDRAERNPESWKVKGVDNHKAKLTEDQVREIRASKKPTRELVLEFGIGRTAVKDIRARKTWQHVDDRPLHTKHQKALAA